MNILITNDDGIRADGIIELAKELVKTHDIYCSVSTRYSQKKCNGASQ